jgi:transposase
MSETNRGPVGAEKRVAAIKKHLIDQVPVSQVCQELGVSVASYYLWQKEFFENGHRAFDKTGRRAGRVEDAKQTKIDTLEAKLQRKDNVIAELMEDHVQLKKSLGEA